MVRESLNSEPFKNAYTSGKRLTPTDMGKAMAEMWEESVDEEPPPDTQRTRGVEPPPDKKK